jgi:hypothetical protein
MPDHIHPKLQHLSSQELETLISRYYGDEKVAALLIEYQIDCTAGQLCSLFPPLQLDQRCPYCSVRMIQKRGSRSSTYNSSAVICPKCTHQKGRYRCQCDNCIAIEAQKKRLESERLKAAINTHLDRLRLQNTKHPSVNELDLRSAVSLLALIRACLFSDHPSHEPLDASEMTLNALEEATIPYTPRGNLSDQLIENLRKMRLIEFSANSTPDALTLENGRLVSFIPSKVRWTLLMPEPHTYFEELVFVAETQSRWPTHWEADVHDVWLEIALAECKEYCAHINAERGLPEPGAKSLDSMLRNLLQNYSVAQCYQVLYVSAQRAVDFWVRTRCNKRHAANYMIGECQRRADRARAENWEVKPFRRNFDLPRSSLSHVFFDVFLKIGEAGFNQAHGTLKYPYSQFEASF